MELKDFVAQTLTQIVEGVKQSQDIALANGAVVNPFLNPMSGKNADHGFLHCPEGFAQIVKFDVALTVA